MNDNNSHAVHIYHNLKTAFVVCAVIVDYKFMPSKLLPFFAEVHVMLLAVYSFSIRLLPSALVSEFYQLKINLYKIS